MSARTGWWRIWSRRGTWPAARGARSVWCCTSRGWPGRGGRGWSRACTAWGRCSRRGRGRPAGRPGNCRPGLGRLPGRRRCCRRSRRPSWRRGWAVVRGRAVRLPGRVGCGWWRGPGSGRPDASALRAGLAELEAYLADADLPWSAGVDGLLAELTRRAGSVREEAASRAAERVVREQLPLVVDGYLRARAWERWAAGSVDPAVTLGREVARLKAARVTAGYGGRGAPGRRRGPGCAGRLPEGAVSAAPTAAERPWWARPEAGCCGRRRLQPRRSNHPGECG